MLSESVFLSSFVSCPPRYKAHQAKISEFLIDIHEASASLTHSLVPVGKMIRKYGVKEASISSRGFESEDFFLPQNERSICQPRENSIAGASILERTQFFGVRAKQVFDQFYEAHIPEPEHIIHVTCTGYISPSAAQLLVAEKKWSAEVTHAYHMGCYAALPAIRIALGQSLGRNQKVDIVHTEMCSLHVNPSLHSPEQLVVQTLFSNGHIKYEISRKKSGPAFRILNIKEKILPDSDRDMGWLTSPSGMSMVLSREVPDKIQKNIREFTTQLLEEAGVSISETLAKGIFAIHPGGPKIIETVGKALELRHEQYALSEKILFEHGNMSSATLPHIWQRIAQGSLPAKTPVVSFAFGPGLTIFGSVFEFNP